MSERRGAAAAKRVRLLVRGVVQGVGFRPYVYQLAGRHGLSGWVMNSAAGVVVEVEGEAAAVDAFVQALPAELPPLARIDELESAEMAAQGGEGFQIRASEAGPGAFTLVSPDICVCEECLREAHDAKDRRHGYAFINCTNCGPRYSIIEDIPYDRRMTTMAGFELCADCRREYEDPADRRFHAQPNACAVCGPRLEWKQVSETAGQRVSESAKDVLRRAAEMLRDGGIVAIKALGGYQLACDAANERAVRELRRRKRRSEKPFAVMMAVVEDVERSCAVSAAERTALLGRERPIVLLRRKMDSKLAEAVSLENPNTGVMLPSTPLHDLLFGEGACPRMLVMTSGNLSEEPIVTANDEAERQLGGVADAFVHHNRPIHTRVDDSIVRVFEERAMVMRRARGYAPQPVWLGLGGTELLATGAQLKSAFCLTRAGFALPSQHLGDLENFETLQFYEQTLERMQRLFHVTPQAVVHDMHPQYMSTQLAMRMDVRRIAVQHHHAHIASCMAEHQLRGQVMGVAWDGTGYGTDGAIWGGEFMVAGLEGFERTGHLRYVRLAGGDAAVREPWRVARSYLRDAFGGAVPAGAAAPVTAEQMRVVDAMLERGLNAAETSSCGRLFDAVASLIGLRHAVTFEGQAAMALEAVADEERRERYEFEVGDSGEIDLREMVRRIVQEVERGTAAGRIAARFHNTLVAVTVASCRRMSNLRGLRRVCLSGGCFQNLRLLGGCVKALRDEGFEVYYQRLLPANDGGIALGQAAVGCEIIRRESGMK